MLAERSQEEKLFASVNGEVLEFSLGSSIFELLAERGLTGKRVAVERNGEIVPRGEHASTILIHGDKLEVVVAVGGG
jgi:sulfur carrier protein